MNGTTRKWYLQTWFIALLIASWPLIITPILGIIFMAVQYNQNKELMLKYGEIDSLDMIISSKETAVENLDEDFARKKSVLQKELNQLEKDIINREVALENELDNLKKELSSLNAEILIKSYDMSNYDGLSSQQCKDKLSLLKTNEQQMIKDNQAVSVPQTGDKKSINNNIKQLIRCFNAECDNILLNVSVKNIDSLRSKTQKSYESLNKIFITDGLALQPKFLELKLEQLNLIYTYELKREQEREQQKAIKEQMIEEERVRREIEREKDKIEKDQSQVSGEINRLMKYLQKTDSAPEKDLYLDKIKELEARLKELEEQKSTILEREANARAGFVYIISNIGSFGEDIYKIGMTRRLEPMDRIKELSSASVPFDFDVHAMIFSNDAPALEYALHKYFEKHSLNKVNPRKEFFRIKLDEIEKQVKESHNNTTEFTYTALAKEYRQSLEIA